MNKNWYAIHTLFNREIIASESIALKGLTTFLPMVQERKPDGVGKWKRVTSPLFPRYLFILSEPENLSAIKKLQGVAYVVSDGDCALSVPEIVIEEIRARIVNGCVSLDDSPFKADEGVVINSGFAAGFLGVFKQWIPAKQKVGILLNILGREQIIHLGLDQVSPLRMSPDYYGAENTRQ
jgi:transcription antitermination factor NusG